MRALKSRLSGIYLRGVAMGAADIVPGVSGGTVALITGIYDRLLGSLSHVDVALLRLLLEGRWRESWRHLDAGFLLTLGAGILTSVITLARVISYLLETYPLQVWGFFFGLILGSAVALAGRVERWTGSRVLLCLAAAALAAGSLWLPGGTGSDSLLAFFGAGALAICAMLLPGVSGSFVLVLLGMYPRVLDAVHEFQWLRLACFAVGAGLGLLSFSRLLHWLLEHRHAPMLSLLTGFLAGSLAVVWPWKLDAGELAAAGVRALPVSPGRYAEVAGSHALLSVMVLLVTALVLVTVVDRRWGGDGA